MKFGVGNCLFTKFGDWFGLLFCLTYTQWWWWPVDGWWESGGNGSGSMGEFLVMVDERKIVRCTMVVVVDKNMDGGRWRE